MFCSFSVVRSVVLKKTVYEKALRGQLSNPDIGKYNADTLSTQNNLATLYYTLNRFDDARTLYETALEGQKQTLGGDHTV